MSRKKNSSRRGGTLMVAGGAVVLVAILVGGVMYLQNSSKNKGAPVGSAPDLVRVGEMSFDILTTSMGDLQAKSSIEIRNKVEARTSIAEIVAEGSFVKKGDLLVRLNGEELDTRIKEQRLEVEEARANFIAAENDLKNQEDLNASNIRKAELAVALAELDLQQWKSDFAKRGIQHDQDLQKAIKNLDRVKKKHEDTKVLYEQGFESQNQVTLDEIEFNDAEARLRIVQTEIEIYTKFEQPKEEKQKVSAVEEAVAELERVKRSAEISMIGKQAQVTNRREQLSGREDRLKKSETQLAACEMRAPTDGLVVYGTSVEEDWRGDSTGTLQIGQEVSFNQLLIVLPDVTDMVAKVMVHESIAGKVKPGQHATVRVDAIAGASFKGTVLSTGVLPQTGGWRDPNRREYVVRVALERGEHYERLKPSMRCEAEIVLGRVDNVAAVPVQAIFHEGPLTYVHVPSGGKFVRQPVAVGRRSDVFAEITAGVTPAQSVLVRAPEARELLTSQWDSAQLSLVGFRLNDQGQPEREATADRGGPGERRGPRPARGGAETPEAPARASGENAPAAESTGKREESQ